MIGNIKKMESMRLSVQTFFFYTEFLLESVYYPININGKMTSNIRLINLTNGHAI